MNSFSQLNGTDEVHHWTEENDIDVSASSSNISQCRMNTLITTLNKLQQAFKLVGGEMVELPQIVVIGYQSSGKSSVLESLVGRDFLPRGGGIVTRRPLILQLITIDEHDLHEKLKSFPDERDAGYVEWAEFDHCPDRTIFDFEKVRDEITLETERTSGSNKNISDVPIFLKIYSQSVITLTLVDLPGITKVPVGDQPENIEILIRDMIIKYIKNKNALILAISAANTDLATSEALQMAREYDPDGRRTLAVLTKLDIMDHGTDAYEMLTGNVIKVKLGIVGVVNRSQRDIKLNKPIQAALTDEITFMKQKYPSISHIHGTEYLRVELNRLLLSHIRQCLPSLKKRINDMLSTYEAQAAELGETVIEKHRYISIAIRETVDQYRSIIDGTSSVGEIAELTGGARICYIFHETFGKKLQSMDPLDGLSRAEILTAIRNSTGPRPALFVPEASFVQLVTRQIKKLERPSVDCANLVYEEMEKILERCDLQRKYSDRFPLLSENINSIVRTVLNECLPRATEFVKNLIAVEMSYVNTKHPDFLEAKLVHKILVEGKPMKLKRDDNQEEYCEADNELEPTEHFICDTLENMEISHAKQRRVSRSTDHDMTLRERKECEIVEKLIDSYFHIVRKSIQDLVPKTIMHFLVNTVKENLPTDLSKLYMVQKDRDLLVESPNVAAQRNRIIQMVLALRNASLIIQEVRDASI